MTDRFDRNLRFFGAEGQARLRATTVAVVGVGGLGTHVVQQLTHLGVGRIVLIDDEELDETNKNRYVGSYANDPVPGTPKVDIGERLANLIDRSVVIEKIAKSLYTEQALKRLASVDHVIGCVDNDGARLVLTEHCLAFSRPYFDLASDIDRDARAYGGRVCVAINGQGCLVCSGELDLVAAREDLENVHARIDRETIYGVRSDELAGAGPSVISINGVVASLAVTEFVVSVTGLRAANRLISYRGDLARVTITRDEPHPGCYYCREVFGLGEEANTIRFARR
jgi:threonine dehydrogenase-like Zn-dependent dehydrogenase